MSKITIHRFNGMELVETKEYLALQEQIAELKEAEISDAKKIAKVIADYAKEIAELKGKATMLDAIAKVGFTPRQLGAIKALKE